MSNYSTLGHVIEEILQVVKPLQEDWEKRTRIIDELRRVIRSVENLRGARVEPFGSFVSNLFTRWGDLDISIDLLNNSCISSAGKRHKQRLLVDIQMALRQIGGWHRLQCIPNARVPILKFESSRQGISCDISIDNLQGQIKSKLLFWISAIDARFRDMVLLVKEWAKAHDINNSKTGTFNSYSLSLLVIFHFQTCVPAILPPLKDIYTGNIAHDLQGVRADAERHIAETCAANITRFKQQKYRQVNRSSLSEIFISFFEKFSDISLRASGLVICPYTGQWEYAGSNMRWLPKTCALFIEDPFQQPENPTRAVTMSNLIKISEAFQMTHRRLFSANQNQGSLIAALVRPQVSQYIPRAPISNPTHNVRRYRSQPTRPQVQRAVLSTSSQVQRTVLSTTRQFQDLSIENQSNNLTLQDHNQRTNVQFRQPARQLWRARSDG